MVDRITHWIPAVQYVCISKTESCRNIKFGTQVMILMTTLTGRDRLYICMYVAFGLVAQEKGIL